MNALTTSKESVLLALAGMAELSGQIKQLLQSGKKINQFNIKPQIHSMIELNWKRN